MVAEPPDKLLFQMHVLAGPEVCFRRRQVVNAGHGIQKSVQCGIGNLGAQDRPQMIDEPAVALQAQLNEQATELKALRNSQRSSSPPSPESRIS